MSEYSIDLHFFHDPTTLQLLQIYLVHVLPRKKNPILEWNLLVKSQ